MELAKHFRDDLDRELTAGVDPSVKDFYDKTKEHFADKEYPFLATKIYGKNPYVFPTPPLNTNETGNTKMEDIQGTKPRERPATVRRTFLDSYGSLGGSVRGVTDRYLKGLSDAERVKLPLLSSQIYNPPAVRQPLQPYDVSLLTPNPMGMQGRIYSNLATEAAAATKERSFKEKMQNWINYGVFK